MSWTTHHRRGDVLREVIRAADDRLDGLLPVDVDGVADTFGDELTLIAALQLRWRSRLSDHVERELADQPADLENAVTRAWLATAEELPGVRVVLDHHVTCPTGPAMVHAMAAASAKDHEMLARTAKVSSGRGEAAARAGRAIERAARTLYVPRTRAEPAPVTPTLAQRLRAVLAA